MATKDEKRTCLNPQHPFKTKTYNYKEGLDDGRYCSTCAFHFQMMRVLVETALQPRQTLYGGQELQTTREQLHDLVNEVADAMDLPYAEEATA